MALLEIDDIHTYYGSIEALKGVSVNVEEGEIVTLIGSNGAGKSTTLRSVSGLTPPRKGAIRFRGTDISRTPAQDIVRGDRERRRVEAAAQVRAHRTLVAQPVGHRLVEQLGEARDPLRRSAPGRSRASPARPPRRSGPNRQKRPGLSPGRLQPRRPGRRSICS